MMDGIGLPRAPIALLLVTSLSACRGAPRTARAADRGKASAVEACTLLQPAEIQQGLGVAVKAGARLAPDDPSQCQWESQVESDGVAVSVSVQPFDDVVFHQLSTVGKAVPVSGLGESAFKGVPHAGDLIIKDGGYEIDIGLVDFNLPQPKADAAVLEFGKLVLARVPTHTGA
jgi:hypothetical protein